MAKRAVKAQALARVTYGILINLEASLLLIAGIIATRQTSNGDIFVIAQLGVTLHFFRFSETHIRTAIMPGLAIRPNRRQK